MKSPAPAEVTVPCPTPQHAELLLERFAAEHGAVRIGSFVQTRRLSASAKADGSRVFLASWSLTRAQLIAAAAEVGAYGDMTARAKAAARRGARQAARTASAGYFDHVKGR